MVVNTHSSECLGDNSYGGFLSSDFCYSYPEPAGSALPVTSWDGLVILGETSFEYSHIEGIDYNYIKNESSRGTVDLPLLPFVLKTTEEGTTDFLPVIASANPTSPGLAVCVYGAAAGYKCGNLTAVNLNLTVPNPNPYNEITT